MSKPKPRKMTSLTPPAPPAPPAPAPPSEIWKCPKGHLSDGIPHVLLVTNFGPDRSVPVCWSCVADFAALMFPISRVR